LSVVAGVALTTASADAHTVNVSASELTVEGSKVHGLVVFAKPDALRLGQIDSNADGVVTEDELEASRATFGALLDHDIEVRADGARCEPTLEGGGDVGGDGFGLSLTFACKSAPHTLAISMDVLKRLAPQHKHFLRLTSGDETRQAVLSPGDTRVEWDLREGGVAPWSALGSVRLGVEHILTGWDHLLFLLALLLGTRGTRPIVLAVTAFTVAHSLTLALAALGLIPVVSRVVEPAIAASIAYVAFENVWRPEVRRRWGETFVFGLVHGLGFAGALRELTVDRERLVPILLGFNAGVEIGQLLVVLALVPLLGLLRRVAPERVFRATSIAVGVVGTAVFVRRAMLP
jgi:hydrogenase/urease accessory protein HupE